MVWPDVLTSIFTGSHGGRRICMKPKRSAGVPAGEFGRRPAAIWQALAPGRCENPQTGRLRYELHAYALPGGREPHVFVDSRHYEA
jgi:hypothetical protein